MKLNLIGYVVLGLLLSIAWFFYRRIMAVKRLQTNVDFPNDFRRENKYIVFTQNLLVNNASNVDLQVSNVNLDVYSSGYFVGKASLPQPQTIGENTISVVSVKVTCSISDLLTSLGVSIQKLITTKKLKLNFEGTIGAYGFTAPVSQSKEIEVPNWIVNLF